MEKIEKSAKKYAEAVYWTTENESYELIEAFKKGAEFMQKEYEEKLRWIPVEEKLPENREVVLVKVPEFSHPFILVYNSVCDQWFEYESNDWYVSDRKPTHWRSFLHWP